MKSRKILITEEVISSVTHGLGLILGTVGSVLFIVFHKNMGILQIISFTVFATCLTILYLASTLSHGLYFTKARKVFQIFDHSSIFLLIAGTYTPFLLTAINGITNIIVLSIIWAVSVAGIVLKSIFLEKYKHISLFIYLMLGWSMIIMLKPLWKSVSPSILLLIFLGGMCYSTGVLFYRAKKIPFHHTIWHVFVLAGSAFHFIAVYSYL